MRDIDRAAALRRCRVELDRLPAGLLADAAKAARASLARRNAGEIWRAAETLREAAAQYGLNANPACAALALASFAFRPPERASEAIEGQPS
jgi:hypothetical protein